MKRFPVVFGRVTAVDGQYQIGIYSVRSIRYGEEITFDYNSVTEVVFAPFFTFRNKVGWLLMMFL